MRYLMRRLRWMALGGALVWLFDPVHGEERRAMIQEQLSSLTGRARELDPRRGEDGTTTLAEVVDDVGGDAPGRATG